ncbi:hypothetical protein BOX15_Mlig029164g2 [Macrostomum lignano]|nr:hypothetical protein BOX15_Mlig029164g2 [Macrostomum lignano]
MKSLGLLPLFLVCLIGASVDACPTLYLQTLRGYEGVLSSNYGFPQRCNDQYAHNLNCRYELVSGRNNPGRGVYISFAYFNTELSYDKVFIEYTNTQGRNVTGYFSGSVGGFSRVLDSQRGTPVRLIFITDHSVSAYGFLVRFKVAPAMRFRLGGTFEVDQNGLEGTIRVDRAKRK